MIKTIKRILIGPLLVVSLSGQESLFWEIADPIVNSEFIESYINRLIEVDKFEENAIQASFSIIVQMDVGDEKIELSKLKAKDYQMGQYISFDMSEVEKMDIAQLNTIMSREYKWKDVSSRDFQSLSSLARLTMSSKSVALKMQGTHSGGQIHRLAQAPLCRFSFAKKAVALLSDLNKVFLILAYQDSYLRILCWVYLMISSAPI